MSNRQFAQAARGKNDRSHSRFRAGWLVAGVLWCAAAWAQGPAGSVPGLPQGVYGGAAAPMPELPRAPVAVPRLDNPGLEIAAAATEIQGQKKIPEKHDVTRIGDRDVGKGLDFYSLERELALGRELAMEVERSARLVSDPVLNEYVNRVAQALVRNSDAQVPFTVKILDDDEVNGFALPGGFFYLNTGLIAAAQSEAELAGVMAHEIAHVAARHSTKNATKAQIMNIVSIPLIFVGGPVGYAAQQAIGLAVPLSILKFNRNAEREADSLGLQYQYASGYDPEEFVRFLERLKAREGDEGGSFLAKAFRSHPMTEDRVERAQEQIERYLPAKTQYVVDTSEFRTMKARLLRGGGERRVDPGPVPVLRRRGPRATGQNQEDTQKDDGEPKLRRRSE